MNGTESTEKGGILKMLENEKLKIKKERRGFIAALILSNMTTALLITLITGQNTESLPRHLINKVSKVENGNNLLQLPANILMSLPKEGEKTPALIYIDCKKLINEKVYLHSGVKEGQEESLYAIELSPTAQKLLASSGEHKFCLYPFTKLNQVVKHTEESYEINM